MNVEIYLEGVLFLVSQTLKSYSENNIRWFVSKFLTKGGIY